jgi:predicted MFS family arabinose efflux permease
VRSPSRISSGPRIRKSIRAYLAGEPTTVAEPRRLACLPADYLSTAASAGTAAAAEWAPPEQRARVLSWALIGNPGAWIVGMPLIGLLGEASWRYAWLALPLAAAVAAAVAVSRGPRSRPADQAEAGIVATLADPGVRRWALAELLANSAWIGLLVYAGALFVESHGASTTRAGVLLAASAAAFVAGNLLFRRYADRDLRRPLRALALAMAVTVAAFGTVRPTLAVSALLRPRSRR